jgi:hypothetical protein
LSWEIFFHTGKRLSGFPASSGKREEQALRIVRFRSMAACRQGQTDHSNRRTRNEVLKGHGFIRAVQCFLEGRPLGPEGGFFVANLPSGAEARHIHFFYGTDKSVPFQNLR